MSKNKKQKPLKDPKRARLPHKTDYTTKFAKDWKRLANTGRFNMNDLKTVMQLIAANDEPLPAQYKDHPLKGEWIGFRECHVGGDFLLIYRLEESQQRVVFTAIGTHAELFK